VRALLRALGGALAACLLGAIALYRAVLAPLVGGRCRFAPSCSVYAAEAIRAYGPFVGSWRALRRLSKCHPFHRGGWDPPVRET